MSGVTPYYEIIENGKLHNLQWSYPTFPIRKYLQGYMSMNYKQQKPQTDIGFTHSPVMMAQKIEKGLNSLYHMPLW